MLTLALVLYCFLVILIIAWFLDIAICLLTFLIVVAATAFALTARAIRRKEVRDDAL